MVSVEITDMRYIKLEKCDGSGDIVYQIHDAIGTFLRFADADGNTIDTVTETIEATVVDADAPAPPWGVVVPPSEPETPPVPVPEAVTKRQFLIQLFRSGMVAPEEVPTLATQPPALMNAVLSQMPTEMALEAQLSWASMTQVERHSPLTLAAAAAGGTTDEQLDQFFIAASVI